MDDVGVLWTGVCRTGLILEMIFGLTGLSGLAGLILLREDFGHFGGMKNVFDNYHCM